MFNEPPLPIDIKYIEKEMPESVDSPSRALVLCGVNDETPPTALTDYRSGMEHDSEGGPLCGLAGGMVKGLGGRSSIPTVWESGQTTAASVTVVRRCWRWFNGNIEVVRDLV